MFYFQILVVQLLCSLLAANQETTCSEETICFANRGEEESECQMINEAKIIFELSNTTVNCTTVNIYVTSGSHELRGNLIFTDFVEETRISGTPNGQNSIVECSNEAAIEFSKNGDANYVFLSNLFFTHCQLLFYYASLSLENIAVMNSAGYGIHTRQSRKQEIVNSTFINNTLQHIFVFVEEYNYPSDTEVLVYLTNTKLFENRGEGVGGFAVIICVWNNASVSIINSTISNNAKGALSVTHAKYLEIRDCFITDNNGNGLEIHMTVGAAINTSVVVIVRNCLVENNAGTAIKVVRDSTEKSMHMLTDISNITFTRNLKALYLLFYSWSHANEHRETTISNCSFTHHKLPPKFSVVQIENVFSNRILNNKVLLENCSFTRNQGASALHLVKMIDFTISDVDIHDNDCTAIALVTSNMKVKNHLDITRNLGWQGGGVSLHDDYVIVRQEYSQILLTNSSMLRITNNTAVTYGGGIFTNETCEARSRNNTCFFQFESTFMTHILMSGNRALIGGDSILGGCLSNCSIEINKRWTAIDKTDPNNTFWTLVSTGNPLSQSTFVEYPTGATFCANTSTSANNPIICNKSRTVSVFRGQSFNVSLIASDELCYPTMKVLKVQGEENLSLLEQGEVLQTEKYCKNYSYALAGGLNQSKTRLEFSFQDPWAEINVPAILTVVLKDCPPGLVLIKSIEQCTCICHDKFKLYKIVCHADRYTLEIPAQIWVGKYEGNIVTQKECQYCRNEVTEQPIDDITNKLCTGKRSGIMCGECIQGYSLKLGGYECASCSKSPLVGVVLVVAFTCAGAILVFLLLRLDLTISTGALNGLIFYSNIVYLNNDIFLPTSKVGGVHLQNAVKILSTLLAWMNLDFGISTCFFGGYNTYISTWMQFAFPLYIWVLILFIVFASWYSTIVARITTSNTVPVLATLLLLSYAKLLKTSIEVFSSVRLFSLDGELLEIAWKQDGNIPYLGQYHLPLFLMSLLMVILYIVPFTLLVLLGPLMRAKSHYRMFRWIHKIKPLLDAFYGCYTIKYRYWPGLLLLTRVAIIGIFSFYPANDSPFKLMTISMMILILFLFWILIGEANTISFYRKRNFNYFELFFLSNLGTLSSVSSYTTQFSGKTLIRNQQVLAIFTVGSAFIVFCGIITYQVSLILLRFRSIRRIHDSVQAKAKQFLVRNKTLEHKVLLNAASNGVSATTAPVEPTHTEIDVRIRTRCDDKLREPLLMDGELTNAVIQ